MEIRLRRLAIDPHSSEEGTPSNVHRCQILFVCRLHDQLIHLTVHGKWN